jgi:hypothetical protein
MIPCQVSLILLGDISARGTISGEFMNVGTESATTILSSEYAPNPTPF